MGGLGVSWPTDTAEDVFQLSAEGSAVLLAAMKGENVSGWLTVGPSREMGFDLPAQMFCGRLNMRHGQGLQGLPAVCDGCGEPFSLEHALSCKKGGNVKLGHGQMMDKSCHLVRSLS